MENRKGLFFVGKCSELLQRLEVLAQDYKTLGDVVAARIAPEGWRSTESRRRNLRQIRLQVLRQQL